MCEQVMQHSQSLTSDSNFIDKHLKVSSENPHLTLSISWYQRQIVTWNVVPFPVHCLLKNPSANISSDDFHHMENSSMFVGSCNGLLCFHSWNRGPEPPFKFLHISNPATRTRSQKIEYTFGKDFSFTFGYDASSRTYKIVAFRADQGNSEVKVFNLGDNCWRNIQNFPVVPYNRLDNCMFPRWFNNGAHFCGTINWLALDKSITDHINQFVIVSLDLSTETYKQFMLPLGLADEVPISQLILRVLLDSLCFSHDSNKTEFILWKMKEYGVQESWIQLFKISYQNLAMQLPMLNIDYDDSHYQLR
ncbi:F-box protein, partial [Trifolium pratense]